MSWFYSLPLDHNVDKALSLFPMSIAISLLSILE